MSCSFSSHSSFVFLHVGGQGRPQAYMVGRGFGELVMCDPLLSILVTGIISRVYLFTGTDVCTHTRTRSCTRDIHYTCPVVSYKSHQFGHATARRGHL